MRNPLGNGTIALLSRTLRLRTGVGPRTAPAARRSRTGWAPNMPRGPRGGRRWCHSWPENESSCRHPSSCCRSTSAGGQPRLSGIHDWVIVVGVRERAFRGEDPQSPGPSRGGRRDQHEQEKSENEVVAILNETWGPPACGWIAGPARSRPSIGPSSSQAWASFVRTAPAHTTLRSE